MIPRPARSTLRACAAVLAIAGAVLMAAYFAKWWPYTHREDWQFTVLTTTGQAVAESGVIPLPFVPCLLLAAGIAMWLIVLLRRPRSTSPAGNDRRHP